MAQKQWSDRKSGKGGLFRRQRVTWSGWIGMSAADALARGGAWQNSASRAAMPWIVNFSTGPDIGACGEVFSSEDSIGR